MASVVNKIDELLNAFLDCCLYNDDDDIKQEKKMFDNEIPHYAIKCKANARKVEYFKSVSAKTLLSSVTTNSNEKIFGYNFEVYDKEKGFEMKTYPFRGVRNHLIVGLHAAFMHHLPFQIRPDDIWIIIAQGIAIHITQNAEKLRDKFVDFDGKKEIIVIDDSLSINSETNDWSYVLKQFDQGCRKLATDQIVDLITCNFNTTSITTQIASKCVLFKAMSEYISFTTMTKSGIPEISLVGSVDDWKKIQTKCRELRKMKIGLEFWLEFLEPVIDNIVQTAMVKSKNETLNEKLKYFWNSIYKFRSNSGGDSISGWVKTLFPYDINMKQNSELKWDYSDSDWEWPHMSPGNFPATYSRAPMKWLYFGKEIKCGMYGGIFGISQQKDNGCIAPVIGWIIAGKQ